MVIVAFIFLNLHTPELKLSSILLVTLSAKLVPSKEATCI